MKSKIQKYLNYKSNLMCKKSLFMLLAVLSLVSCQDIIQIDLKKGDTLLVVDAFVNNKPEPQKIRLTFTADYFSNTSTPPVLGANVSLTDLTNAKTYTFTPDGNGNYLYTPILNDSMAQVNHNYQLNISYNGSNYTSTCKLKRTANIDSIGFFNSRRGFGNNKDTSNPRKFYPYLFAHDTSGGTDYYWIKTYKDGMFYNAPRNLNVAVDNGGYQDGKGFIPPNAFFNLVNDPFYRLDKCTIEIHSISSETYDFLSQMQTQMTNAQSGLFAVTPENVKTNISVSGSGYKAIGWFCMSATSSKSRIAGS
jgi:hypothetical protein